MTGSVKRHIPAGLNTPGPAPKQASLRAGAGVCVAAFCLLAARLHWCTTDGTDLLSVCAWLFLDGWESRSWTPCLLGATHGPGGRWMGLLLFLALSFTKSPECWIPHSWLSRLRSPSNWQRWMCKECRFSTTAGVLANNK